MANWEPQGLKTLRRIVAMGREERAKLPCTSCGQPIGHGDWRIPTCQKCRAKLAALTHDNTK